MSRSIKTRKTVKVGLILFVGDDEDGNRKRRPVCGTLFGARSWRIRDIVLDWISVLKGWRTL